MFLLHYITFFHLIKILFYYMNYYSFDTFLVTISGLLFLFAKSQNFTFSIQIEQQYNAVRKMLRRI